MKCKDILAALEELCPLQYREDWDNVGLLVGDGEREVNTVYLALDATTEVIDQACAAGAQLLLTHHPLIFDAMKKVTADDITGRRIIKLIQNDISHIAMHTNFDVMGMADAAADKLGLADREVLEVTYEDELSVEGIGRIGNMQTIMPMNAGEYAREVAQIFNLENVRIWGDTSRMVRRVAIMPGSGGEYFARAAAAGADVLITGDVKHHQAIDAAETGIPIIDAGHRGTEKLFDDYMQEFFRRTFPQIQVIKERDHEPFTVIVM